MIIMCEQFEGQAHGSTQPRPLQLYIIQLWPSTQEVHDNRITTNGDREIVEWMSSFPFHLDTYTSSLLSTLQEEKFIAGPL